jgi:hypothetical protein
LLLIGIVIAPVATCRVLGVCSGTVTIRPAGVRFYRGLSRRPRVALWMKPSVLPTPPPSGGPILRSLFTRLPPVPKPPTTAPVPTIQHYLSLYPPSANCVSSSSSLLSLFTSAFPNRSLKSIYVCVCVCILSISLCACIFHWEYCDNRYRVAR